MAQNSHVASRQVTTSAPHAGLRFLGGLAVLAGVAAVAGCAVSNADTLTTPHRGGSIFSSVAGTTTSDVTSTFPSSTTSQVVRGDLPALQDGTTGGNLAALSPNAQWTLNVQDALPGLRLGPLYGATDTDPIQIGDVIVVGLHSSVLNSAGSAAFSMTDGSLLWQDRSLECQAVDLGGALPCRQNKGQWAPFNPSTATFGEAINPGFAPEAFGFADGILYSARSTGAGELQVAAGTVAQPAASWTVTVPRTAEATVAGTASNITVAADAVDVQLGAATIELTKNGQPLTELAQLADDAKLPGVHVEKQVGDLVISNDMAGLITARRGAEVLWSVPGVFANDEVVTDGRALTFVSGTDTGNKLTTISLATGELLQQRDIVALNSQPKKIQSAASGIFHVDGQFSTISYYRA
ncbi:hypothetical protein [Corynebacterium epidermidicanis]|uniref:Uncharacterized protein n=1 Tax=Corynebacterium epidermidicanis TaxID=1050174 RepID=A0A0G3GPB5_9CORY|nr:hypothetical protein [Corynebacterium epidermidicanis]AKK03066.1 hypothetical protein CEPID_06025 [Corynebacterium epidermidicanis]